MDRDSTGSPAPRRSAALGQGNSIPDTYRRARTRPVTPRSLSSGCGGVSQHDEQHPARLRGIEGVRNVGRHTYYSPWRGMDRGAANSESQRSFEDQYERVKRRRVLTESLPLVEREEREIATGGFRQDSARDPLFGGRDEGVQPKGFGWRNCLSHSGH